MYLAPYPDSEIPLKAWEKASKSILQSVLRYINSLLVWCTNVACTPYTSGLQLSPKRRGLRGLDVRLHLAVEVARAASLDDVVELIQRDLPLDLQATPNREAK